MSVILTRGTATRDPAGSLPDLVVFSHLRWGFVYQRPQHLMSRLAQHWRVCFVEEPVYEQGAPRLVCETPQAGVTVVTPHTPLRACGFHDDQLGLLEPLLRSFFHARGVSDAVGWLYTPQALPWVKTLHMNCLVYDCMDELTAFQGAPPQLGQREAALLDQAAVVFTGGPSLYEAKRRLHPKVVCVPSSVDAAHFSPDGLDPNSPHHAAAQALQAALPRPRLGFFGVIDERLDVPLLQRLADAHPEWQLVMVGPVAKIDPAMLPQRPNVHWLGMQPYERLPYLLAGWDICLMPFALNDATRYISPTKTLEYMAGEKPIVSTPVNDVLQLYGHAVRIAQSDAFVEACEQVWEQVQRHNCLDAQAMLMTVSSQSWDRSASTIHRLLEEALNESPSGQRRQARPRVAA